MTAEIAIANKTAIALAADSKVTIGGSRGQKTYDTVNKVFTLSKIHPVGIMIFGNAEFMSYPWETIIKLYRRERGGVAKDRIETWNNDFLGFLSKFGDIKDEHRQGNVRSITWSCLQEVEDRAITRAQNDGHAVPSPEYTNTLLGEMASREARATQREQWRKTPVSEKFAEEVGPGVMRAITDMFGPPTAENDAVCNAAIKMAVAILVSKEFSPHSSGFVIAGFGDKDFFPTMIETVTDGYVGKKIKISQVGIADVARTNAACIRAFAQKDMVQGFMNGVDSALALKLQGMFREALRDSSFTVLETYGTKKNQTAKIRAELNKAVNNRVADLFTRFWDLSKDTFSGPVVDMVALLPKDELAHLAESLVALTSLKRRVSTEAETVGGPIDVALISKGDGFVWIKRKHYFKPELNPLFVRNYMDDALPKAGQ